MKSKKLLLALVAGMLFVQSSYTVTIVDLPDDAPTTTETTKGIPEFAMKRDGFTGIKGRNQIILAIVLLVVLSQVIDFNKVFPPAFH